MKLKKRQFARLKDIAEAVNHVLPGTGIQLDKLITDIESVQKTKEEFAFTDIDQLQKEFGNIKTVQEKPLSFDDFVKETIFDNHRKSVYDYIRKQGKPTTIGIDGVAEFKGGLRDVVELGPTPKEISDFLDEALVLSNKEPKIGDVGFFWYDASDFVFYGILSDIKEDKEIKYMSNAGTYMYFSKTPPELK